MYLLDIFEVIAVWNFGWGCHPHWHAIGPKIGRFE